VKIIEKCVKMHKESAKTYDYTEYINSLLSTCRWDHRSAAYWCKL